jgi:hypothetical protein
MNKLVYHIILIGFIFLAAPGILKAEERDYIKNIEIMEDSIDIDHHQLPYVAYLCVTLKNNGDKKISNLTFEICYYGKEDCLVQKAVIKNALNEAIPKGEVRKYRIPLSGDFVNIEHEQYPYSQSDKVNEYDIKIKNIKFASR